VPVAAASKDDLAEDIADNSKGQGDRGILGENAAAVYNLL
jgi:hypothetical protein